MLGDAVRLKTGEWSGTLQTANGPMPMREFCSTLDVRDGNTWKIREQTVNASRQSWASLLQSLRSVCCSSPDFRSPSSSARRGISAAREAQSQGMSSRLPILQPPDVQQIAFEINPLTRLVSVGIRPFGP